MTSKAASVDEYLKQFSGEQLKRLQTLRDLVQKYAPDALEGIFYGMPGYKTFGKPLFILPVILLTPDCMQLLPDMKSLKKS